MVRIIFNLAQPLKTNKLSSKMCVHDMISNDKPDKLLGDSNENTWQTNPKFGELFAQVQLFESQVNGGQIGQIFIGDSGMGYFCYHVGDSEEYQIKLETIKPNEVYSGKHILTDYSECSVPNMIQLDTEVRIEVIVEECEPGNSVNGGNAWVIRSEKDLANDFFKPLPNEVFDWSESIECE